MTTVVAAIMQDPEYSSVAMVERRRWVVAVNTLGANRQRYTDTKRQAIAWCEEMGITTVVQASPTRTAAERLAR